MIRLHGAGAQAAATDLQHQLQSDGSPLLSGGVTRDLDRAFFYQAAVVGTDAPPAPLDSLRGGSLHVEGASDSLKRELQAVKANEVRTCGQGVVSRGWVEREALCLRGAHMLPQHKLQETVADLQLQLSSQQRLVQSLVSPEVPLHVRPAWLTVLQTKEKELLEAKLSSSESPSAATEGGSEDAEEDGGAAMATMKRLRAEINKLKKQLTAEKSRCAQLEAGQLHVVDPMIDCVGGLSLT